MIFLATGRTATEDQSVSCTGRYQGNSCSTAGPGGSRHREERWTHHNHRQPDPAYGSGTPAAQPAPGRAPRPLSCGAVSPRRPSPGRGGWALVPRPGAGPAAPPQEPFPARRSRLRRHQPPAGHRRQHRLPRPRSARSRRSEKSPRILRSAAAERARCRPRAAAAPRPPAPNPPRHNRPTCGEKAAAAAPRARAWTHEARLGPAHAATTAAALRDAGSGSSVPPPAPAAAATGLSVRRRHFVGVSAAEGFPDMGSSQPALRAQRSPRSPDPDGARQRTEPPPPGCGRRCFLRGINTDFLRGKKALSGLRDPINA